MNGTRAFREDDVPDVARLFGRVFPSSGWRSEAACEAYFRDIFFGNPWYDPDIPSWVAEVDGVIAGFYGIVPRRMTFRGRPIRVAVGCNLMVDAEKGRAVTALELLKANFAGPQDLTLADGATAKALQIWCRIGGRAPLAYNLHWIRPLRPARYVLSLVAGRGIAPPAVAGCMRPIAAMADAAARRLRPNRFLAAGSDVIDEPFMPESIDTDFESLIGRRALRPVYDASSFSWLLEQAAHKPLGQLRARRVTDGGKLLGWYIYYLNARGVSELVQIAARDGQYDRVLQALLIDAWRSGASAVRGRLDPDGVQPLSQRHCWLRWDEPSTLVHSRDPEITAAIERGDAFLSRLDGEWWMRFGTG